MWEQVESPGIPYEVSIVDLYSPLQIQSNGVQHYLGVFETESEAAAVYNQVSSQLHPTADMKCNLTEVVRETIRQRKMQSLEEPRTIDEYMDSLQQPMEVVHTSSIVAPRTVTMSTSSDDVADTINARYACDPLLHLKLRLGQVIRQLTVLNSEVIVQHSAGSGGLGENVACAVKSDASSSEPRDLQIVSLLQEQRDIVARILSESVNGTVESSAGMTKGIGNSYPFDSSSSSLNSSSTEASYKP